MMTIEKYRKPTIYALIAVAALLSIFLFDRYILPQQTKIDALQRYYEITVQKNSAYGSSNIPMGYRYYTEKGISFTIEDVFIKEKHITLTQTLLFKHVSSVQSSKKDYTYKLVSGLNGICLWFTYIILLSVAISLTLLIRNNNITKNVFQNILLFNAFMLFITWYLFALYN